MDRKGLIKKLESTLLVLVLAVVITACSKDEDNPDAVSINPEGTTLISLDHSYRGLWMVDDVKADTSDIRVISTDNKFSVTFEGLPYKAIASRIFPDVNVAKITNSMIVGGPLSPDEAMLLQTIIDHGDVYNCMETFVANDYRFVGMSQTAIYLELMSGRDVSVLYLPFVVTTDQGEVFSVTATLVPSKSTVLVSSYEPILTSLLTVSQIEIVRNGEKQIKTLSPEMQLKFVGHQITKYTTVGN